jgi:hypothetical protein
LVRTATSLHERHLQPHTFVGTDTPWRGLVDRYSAMLSRAAKQLIGTSSKTLRVRHSIQQLTADGPITDTIIQPLLCWVSPPLELSMSSELMLQPLPRGSIVADKLDWCLAVRCWLVYTDTMFQEQLHDLRMA